MNLKSLSQNTKDSIKISNKAVEQIYKELKICEGFISSYHSQKIITENLIKNNLKKISDLQVKNIKIETQKKEIDNLVKTNEKTILKAKRRGRNLPIVGFLALIVGVVISK